MTTTENKGRQISYNVKIRNLLTVNISILVLSMVVVSGTVQSFQNKTNQEKPGFRWPEGKKMGLSLTFDDARLSQVNKGIPLLDKYHVKEEIHHLY
jgi:hypothetical protein